MQELNCFECGANFTRYGSKVMSADACCSKICSREMRRKKSIEKRTKPCALCGELFLGQNALSKFCSTACAKSDRSARQKDNSWKKYKCNCERCGVEFLPPRQAEGGRFCSSACRCFAARKERIYRDGYYMVRIEGHPNATKQGYILEHRAVMEKSIGRHLSKEEVVHHINLNKSDNRVENLMIMTDSEHKSYHANLTHIVNQYTGKSCDEVSNG